MSLYLALIFSILSLNQFAYAQDETPRFSKDEIRTFLEQPNLYTCGPNISECRTDVAMVLAVHPTTNSEQFEVSGCSATLISPNTVLTAKHCLSDAVTTRSPNCNEKMYFLFPSKGGIPAVTATCEYLVAQSESEIINEWITPDNDWAILKISNEAQNHFSNQSPLTLAPSLRNATQVNIIGVDPSGCFLYRDLFNCEKWGQQLKIDGYIAENNIPAPYRYFEYSGVFQIVTPIQPVNPGMSGSGIFVNNQSNQLIGVTNREYHSRNIQLMAARSAHRSFPYQATASFIQCIDSVELMLLFGANYHRSHNNCENPFTPTTFARRRTDFENGFLNELNHLDMNDAMQIILRTSN